MEKNCGGKIENHFECYDIMFFPPENWKKVFPPPNALKLLEIDLLRQSRYKAYD